MIRPRPRAAARIAGLLVLLLAITGLAGCGEGKRSDAGSDEGHGSKSAASSDGAAEIGAGDLIPASDLGGEEAPGLAHVHGLGVNPSDGSTLIATHFGLWRLPKGGAPERLGDNVHDLMGFSVVGPDHFVASGHPNGAPALPPLLGLVESKDAGTTWRSVSLLGKADFHALRTAGTRTYGLNSADGVLMASSDQRTWSTDSAPVQLIDFAIQPNKPDRLVGAVAISETKLETRSSTDGGRSWKAVPGAPQLLRFAWRAPNALWGFDIDGGVWKSADQGRSWQHAGKLAGAPEAVADTGDGLLAAVGGAIVESADGAAWHELYRYGQ